MSPPNPLTPDGRSVFTVRKQGSNAYAIGIPYEIGRLLEGALFAFTLTDEGFSYVPVEDLPEEGMPKWLSERRGGEDRGGNRMTTLEDALSHVLTICEDGDQEWQRHDVAAIARAALADSELV